MRPFGLGPTELIIILAIVLLLFGPKQLPKLGRMFGKAMKDLREGMEGKGAEEEASEPEVLAPGEAEAKAAASDVKQEEKTA
jgi:sec-independent protein translocase protein TatA